MTHRYEVLGSEQVHSGWVGLRVDRVRMSDGHVALREVVTRYDAVAVLALDDQDRVVMVEQYRHPVRRTLRELPAGVLDIAGEDPLDGARRELAEEAHVTAAQWSVLVDLFTSPGGDDEAIRVYLARGLTEVPHGDRYRPEGNEEVAMTVVRVPIADAVAQVMSSEICNATAAAGILAAQLVLTGGAVARPADAEWTARTGG